MRLQLKHGLLFVDALLTFRGRTIALGNVILDTGSAGTIFSADRLAEIDLRYEPDDRAHRIRGVGGSEFVFTKQVDSLVLADVSVTDFEIEIGAMEYGLKIDGLIGMDFLVRVGAMIDVKALEIRAA